MNIKPAILLALCASLSGCFTPDPKSLDSDRAPSAVPAIKDAGEAKDQKAIPRLITDLDAPDPAIRFAAINALSQITGETFDYYYYDDEQDRQPAIQRWQAWLTEHPVPSGTGD
jgi:hypothetical protein